MSYGLPSNELPREAITVTPSSCRGLTVVSCPLRRPLRRPSDAWVLLVTLSVSLLTAVPSRAEDPATSLPQHNSRNSPAAESARANVSVHQEEPVNTLEHPGLTEGGGRSHIAATESPQGASSWVQAPAPGRGPTSASSSVFLACLLALLAYSSAFATTRE